jgi:uncharacterized protein YcnI
VPPAGAHVTVAPRETPAGAEQHYCIRVPSEKAVPTVSLEVEFSGNLQISAIEAPNGWRASTHKDRQGRIVSAIWDGGSIAAKQFLEFGVIARNPDTPATVTWKAIQKYQDGSEVHWIGRPEAQFPAPTTQVLRSQNPAAAVTCAQEAQPSTSVH